MSKFSEIFEFSKEKFRKILILKEFEWFEWFEWFGPSPIEPFNSGASCQGARGVVLARPVPRKFAIRWLRGTQRHVRFRKCELVAVDVRPEPLQWRKGGLCFF